MASEASIVQSVHDFTVKVHILFDTLFGKYFARFNGFRINYIILMYIIFRMQKVTK